MKRILNFIVDSLNEVAKDSQLGKELESEMSIDGIFSSSNLSIPLRIFLAILLIIANFTEFKKTLITKIMLKLILLRIKQD